MRLEALTVPNGVVLRFDNEFSVGLKSSEVKGLGLQEVALMLVDKLEKMAELRVVEPIEALVEEFELDGDEDDEDLSLFEVVIEL